ncbi:hypothetical protein [Microbacterium sp.]|uniref:hypothetical protein n=1 Tax=Microbacterium sp. TaxID=51671 RepID=UPI003A924FCB
MSAKKETSWGRLVARANSRVYSWLVPVLGVFALAGTTSAAAGWWWAAVGILCAGVAAASQILQNRWTSKVATEKLAKAQREAFVAYEDAVERHTLLADQLDPIARTVAEMSELGAAEREAVFQRVVTQAVNSIMLAIPGVRGLRVVVYEVAADQRSMQAVYWNARTHRLAPNPFERGTTRGDSAFDLLTAGEPLFVPDISAAPDEWAGSGNGYNTFISCPITSPVSSFGLLTVDAQNIDDLGEEDVTDIRLLAGILSGAFAERMRSQ